MDFVPGIDFFISRCTHSQKQLDNNFHMFENECVEQDSSITYIDKYPLLNGCPTEYVTLIFSTFFLL